MGLLNQVAANRGSYGSLVATDDDRIDRRKTWVAAAMLVLLLLALGASFAFGARESVANERDVTTACLLHAETPSATLALLDVTDPLAAGSGQRFTNLVTRIRDDLPKNGRLTIVPFGGDLGKSLAPVFDQCSPGRGAQADVWTEGAKKVERRYQQGFAAKVAGAADQLIHATPSNLSPITAQIARAVSDPAIPWSGTSRTLVLLTDGLENTAESPVYRRGKVTLPPPPNGLLRGVTVEYVELVNPERHALQTATERETWRAWFMAAGATDVHMYAAGYARPSA